MVDSFDPLGIKASHDILMDCCLSTIRISFTSVPSTELLTRLRGVVSSYPRWEIEEMPESIRSNPFDRETLGGYAIECVGYILDEVAQALAHLFEQEFGLRTKIFY